MNNCICSGLNSDCFHCGGMGTINPKVSIVGPLPQWTNINTINNRKVEMPNYKKNLPHIKIRKKVEFYIMNHHSLELTTIERFLKDLTNKIKDINTLEYIGSNNLKILENIIFKKNKRNSKKNKPKKKNLNKQRLKLKGDYNNRVDVRKFERKYNSNKTSNPTFGDLLKKCNWLKCS